MAAKTKSRRQNFKTLLSSLFIFSSILTAFSVADAQTKRRQTIKRKTVVRNTGAIKKSTPSSHAVMKKNLLSGNATSNSPLSLSDFTANSPLPGNNSSTTIFTNQVAQMEVNVERPGKGTQSLLGVPHIKGGDIVKIQLLENSNLDAATRWTLMVAFINPTIPPQNTAASKNATIPKEIRLYENNQRYAVHSFTAPYDSLPIIFLVPEKDYRDAIFKKLVIERDVLTQIGNAIVEISGAHSKMSRFLDGLQNILQTPPRTENESDSRIERLAQILGTNLPSGWRTPNGNANANWTEKINFIKDKTRPEEFEKIFRNALTMNKEQLESFVISEAYQQVLKNFPTISPYIELAVGAIKMIKNIFLKAKKELVLLPALIKPLNASAQSFPNRISLFLDRSIEVESRITGIPFVPHRWQLNDDSESILIPKPLANCLNAGLTKFTNTDSRQWAADTFSREFKLVLKDSADRILGSFDLQKNIGFDSWETNFKPEDMELLGQASNISGEIVGKVGFSEIKSEDFNVRVTKPQEWEITKESSRKLIKDGSKKTITIRSRNGDGLCLANITFIPDGSGESKIFEIGKQSGLTVAADGSKAEITLDTANLSPGTHKLQIRQMGETDSFSSLDVKLYPKPPENLNFKIRVGDKQGVLTGERLGQITKIKLNGRAAELKERDAGKITVVYADGEAQPAAAVALEITLEDERLLSDIIGSAQNFSLQPEKARLALQPNTGNEYKSEFDSAQSNAFDLKTLPIVPTSAPEIKVSVRHKMNGDYNFQAERLRAVKLRIENGNGNTYSLPLEKIEVLDARELILSIPMDMKVGSDNNLLRDFAAGQRVQFQIEDSERGLSDWQTVQQTFVRLPKIEKVECPPETERGCELSGQNLRFIREVSVDGGATYPTSVSGAAADKIQIPRLNAKESLFIKLRDFSSSGLRVIEYNFVMLPPPQQQTAN